MIWCVVGCLFLGLGLYAWFSKKARALGFWANAEMFEVTDVKKYNRAMARLFWAFGVVMIGLGIPLLGGGEFGLDSCVGGRAYGGEHRGYGGILSGD